jgi:hypothetical protein
MNMLMIDRSHGRAAQEAVMWHFAQRKKSYIMLLFVKETSSLIWFMKSSAKRCVVPTLNYSSTPPSSFYHWLLADTRHLVPET